MIYGVTEETIRRDLEKLENEGFVKKMYGGAVLVENENSELPFNLRKLSNIKEKRHIAKIAAELIEDGDTVMFDSSSTSFEVAKAIKSKKRITVITNSMNIVLELSMVKDFKIISTGGILNHDYMCYYGSDVKNTIKKYNAQKAIISCKGLYLTKGIMDSSEEIAEMKQEIISNSTEVILVADNTKFDKTALINYFDLDVLNYIVTDQKPSEKWEKVLHEKKIILKY